MEICVNLGPHIAMVACFHQSNVYIKRKLRGWRAQKCIPLVGGKPPLTCAGLQTTPVHGAQYRANNGNLRKFGSTYHHSTVFAPKQCLYQKESKGMESSKSIPLVSEKTVLTCAGLQTTPVHGGNYRAENGNLRKFGSTYRHGTLFTPRQCLCQKKAKGMESSKM